MPRIPEVSREDLSAEEQGYYDEIVQSRGGIRGPYGVMLHSPKLAACVAATGAYVRFEGDMANSLREVVVIAAAREIKSQFEFSAHARLARAEGVTEDTIRAIAQGSAPEGLSGDEALVVRYVQELIRDHKVTDATFGAAKDRFGVKGTVELTGLIGHYLLVGQILAAFDVELTAGMVPEIPE